MPDMQEIRNEDNQEPGQLCGKSGYRFLEDANGVNELFIAHKFVAKCYRTKLTTVVSNFPDEGGTVKWERWEVDRLVWSHNASLYFLQGGTIADILYPLIPLRCVVTPRMSPEPGLSEAVLAQVVETGMKLSKQELFNLLVSVAR